MVSIRMRDPQDVRVDCSNRKRELSWPKLRKLDVPERFLHQRAHETQPKQPTSIHQTATLHVNQQNPHELHSQPNKLQNRHPQHLARMSFLFGGGRPQPSSAEKIAAAEAEIEMVSGMFNQYVPLPARSCASISKPLTNADCLV